MKKKHVEIKPFIWIHRAASLICRCDMDIHIFETGRAAVIAADREDNGGMDIRTGAVHIAESILGKYGFPPADLVWVERRADEEIQDGTSPYDRVEFTFSGGMPSDPVRTPMDETDLEKLLRDLNAG